VAGPRADKPGGPPAASQAMGYTGADLLNRGLKTAEIVFGPAADDAAALGAAPAL